jgi:hypothetical protein
MSRDPSIGRREFLVGPFRGRNAAPDSSEAFGWARGIDEPRVAEGGSDPAKASADWEQNMDRVLQAMNDLTGIEDP